MPESLGPEIIISDPPVDEATGKVRKTKNDEQIAKEKAKVYDSGRAKLRSGSDGNRSRSNSRRPTSKQRRYSRERRNYDLYKQEKVKQAPDLKQKYYKDQSGYCENYADRPRKEKFQKKKEKSLFARSSSGPRPRSPSPIKKLEVKKTTVPLPGHESRKMDGNYASSSTMKMEKSGSTNMEVNLKEAKVPMQKRSPLLAEPGKCGLSNTTTTPENGKPKFLEKPCRHAKISPKPEAAAKIKLEADRKLGPDVGVGTLKSVARRFAEAPSSAQRQTQISG